MKVIVVVLNKTMLLLFFNGFIVKRYNNKKTTAKVYYTALGFKCTRFFYSNNFIKTRGSLVKSLAEIKSNAIASARGAETREGWRDISPPKI